MSDNFDLREEVLSAKKALFVGAHPDDIEFYCGGTICLMRERGVEVTYVVATRGGRGGTGGVLKRLEQARTEQQMEAAAILGVERVRFLDHPDKSLSDHVDKLADDLRLIAAEEQPDIVLSWDPDFIYNPHPDHQAAADAVQRGLSDQRLIFYGTRKPNLWIGFGDEALRPKLRSLRAHRTETPWYYWPYQKRLLMRRLRGEGAKIGEAYAEVYREALGARQ